LKTGGPAPGRPAAEVELGLMESILEPSERKDVTGKTERELELLAPEGASPRATELDGTPVFGFV